MGHVSGHSSGTAAAAPDVGAGWRLSDGWLAHRVLSLSSVSPSSPSCSRSRPQTRSETISEPPNHRDRKQDQHRIRKAEIEIETRPLRLYTDNQDGHFDLDKPVKTETVAYRSKPSFLPRDQEPDLQNILRFIIRLS